MSQELKKNIESALQHVKDIASQSSLADLRANVTAAIDGAKVAANDHIDEFQRLNSKADPVADRLLDKAKESKYSALYIAFVFALGAVGGFWLHSVI